MCPFAATSGAHEIMDLTIGKHAGFCFGVRRAVKTAFDAAEEKIDCVTLGPLIHNPQEVERLEQAGIRSVDSLDEVAPGRRSSSVPTASRPKSTRSAMRAAFVTLTRPAPMWRIFTSSSATTALAAIR